MKLTQNGNLLSRAPYARRAVVAATDDQNRLKHIARTDRHWTVRCAAIKKINDIAFLDDLVKTESEKVVLTSAITQITKVNGAAKQFEISEDGLDEIIAGSGIAGAMERAMVKTQADAGVIPLRYDQNWYIEVNDVDSAAYYSNDELLTRFHDNIIEGMHRRDDMVVIHNKDNAGNWQRTESTLFDYAKNHSKLRSLYQPVWGYAMEGLRWGAIAGAFLKLADTFVMLLMADTGLAVLFAFAVGSCFIPRIGVLGMFLISFILLKFSPVNFFIMGLTSALTGAILGCLPGMAIGGIIGFCKKNSLQLAPDASPNPTGLALKAVIIPLLAGCTLILLYIFVFTPWLLSVLE